MDSIVIDLPPEAQDLAVQTEATLTAAQDYVIDCPEMYEMAGEELRGIKGQRSKLDELRRTMTRPLDEAKKRIMDLFRPPLDRLDQAEGTLKRSMLAFQREEARQAAEARRIAQEAARAEQERLAREAEEAEQAGRHEEAEAKIEIAAMVETPVVAAPPTKASGISTREVWSAEVTNLKELCRAIGAGKAPVQCVVPDARFLNGQARALKSALDYPGVRAVSEQVLAARAS